MRHRPSRGLTWPLLGALCIACTGTEKARSQEQTKVDPSEPAAEQAEPPAAQPASNEAWPKPPESISFEADYAGEPLLRRRVRDGIVHELLTEGEGPTAKADSRVYFEFTGYSTAMGSPVMGSRDEPAGLVLRDNPDDPIQGAMVDALMGTRAGERWRIHIPEAIVEAKEGEKHADIGAVWIVGETVRLAEPHDLAPLDAFSGDPVAARQTSDDLEIIDYRAGEGPAAGEGDRVEVHYIGQLADGKEFDSSRLRADPLELVLGETPAIQGFTDGLEGARKGMLRKLVIPPELGYGEREKPKIPAGSTLVFFVEVMSVTPKGTTLDSP